MKEIESIKLFLSNIKYDFNRVILVVVLSLLFALFDGISLGTLIPLLQSISENGTADNSLWNYIHSFFGYFNIEVDFSTLLLVIFFIFFLRQIVGHFRKNYQYKIAYDFVLKLRSDLFRTLIRSDMFSFNTKKAGELVNSLLLESNLAGSGFIIIVELLNTLLILMVYGVLLLLISWQMTVMTVFILVLVSYLLNNRVQVSRKHKEDIVELNNRLNSVAVESFGGFRLIKSSATEQNEIDKFHAIAKKNSSLQHKFDVNGVDISLVFEFILFSTILFILYLFIKVFMLPLTSLLVFMVVMVRMVPYAQTINTHRHLIAGYSQSLVNVTNSIKDASTSSKIINGTVPFKGFEKSIQIRNVTFSYDKDNVVLDNIDLTIENGKFIAFVGSSGSGKSTLIDLLLRLYDPDEGQILVDGVDLKCFDISSFRRAIGVVSQDTFLFNDTVASNIGYGSDASLDDIVEAAKSAHAHDFIIKLPQKYDTMLGDRGVKLSGGQKQRLALARAIVKDPQILILDEATSALDTESERMIQDSLLKIGHKYTIIAIAHRLSTIEKSDMIYVLESGNIVESGTHSDLIQINSFYAKYHLLQSQ